MYHPKKVGTLPVAGSFDSKQTNEIGMFIPLLDGIDIKGKDITADALLTQRKLATYVVQREAHYHFAVKGNPSDAPIRHRTAVSESQSARFHRCFPTGPWANRDPAYLVQCRAQHLSRLPACRTSIPD
ncbi:MAG: transposase [Nitrosomonas sp.]|nr:transposase [Nitrosomonas sp.]